MREHGSVNEVMLVLCNSACIENTVCSKFLLMLLFYNTQIDGKIRS